MMIYQTHGKEFKILRTEMGLQPTGSSSMSKTLSMSLLKMGMVSILRTIADLY